MQNIEMYTRNVIQSERMILMMVENSKQKVQKTFTLGIGGGKDFLAGEEVLWLWADNLRFTNS